MICERGLWIEVSAMSALLPASVTVKDAEPGQCDVTSDVTSDPRRTTEALLSWEAPLSGPSPGAYDSYFTVRKQAEGDGPSLQGSSSARRWN